MSEIQRAARSLLEVRSENFPSDYSLEESRARVGAALERARIPLPATFETAWSEQEEKPTLTVTHRPPRATRTFLNLTSIAFMLLVAASVYLVWRTDEGALRFLVPLFTVLAILGLPFVTLAMASNREAFESRVRRAIRAALQKPDEE